MMAKVVVVLVFLVALSAGCVTPKPPFRPAVAYHGRLESLAEVVDVVNRNNAKVHKLWARQECQLWITDQRGEHYYWTEGTFMFRQPRDIRLRGSEPIAGAAFDLGSNSDVFWLTVYPKLDTRWWGAWRDADKIEMMDEPISPEAVVWVLALDQIGRDFTRSPIPLMRYDAEADSYVITWAIQTHDRWVLRKEVWYDRSSKLPIRVQLYCPDGRLEVRATLADHMPVESAELSRPEWPKVATAYWLVFPQSGSQLHVTLKGLISEHRGLNHPAAFAFPSNPGVSRDIRLTGPNDGGRE